MRNGQTSCNSSNSYSKWRLPWVSRGRHLYLDREILLALSRHMSGTELPSFFYEGLTFRTYPDDHDHEEIAVTLAIELKDVF